ncbi:S-layer homology domain-containing protein [Planococcus ruber]|uniref:S-layer homology domain-containing protein n=1 Tax=Planococcus ruber TaxID=2027871 RepID=UPI001FEEC6FA|nr:S-layer homology domain-containing protein [Planococcus ruber]MCJ1908254.1 S-layer homology domain-containing protein [Planococcus ruber]
MKKYPMISAAALALTLLVSPAQAATDLPKSHGFYDEMTYLVNKGVISGYEDGTIKPDKVVTRAEAAIMIGKLKNFKGTQTSTNFKDVSKSQKASGFIAEAAKAGFISGYPDGTFKPYAPITRGDMSIILDRTFNIFNGVGAPFSDVSPNMKSYNAIATMVSGNITAGYSDNTFRPNQAITRGQLAAFMSRVLEPKFKNDTHMTNSYLRDKTKIYSYSTKQGTATLKFEEVPVIEGNDFGFMWVTRTDWNSATTLLVENETKDALIYGLPYSEAETEIVYPIQVGKTFENGLGERYISTITGVNKTVNTPYKKFTNAVEITIESGEKYYMVEGYGSVKALDAKGETVSELSSVK